jgi:flagellar biosynthesis regulator FlbT
MNPQGIPVMELQNRITDEFSDFSSVVILIQLDENSDINDVRDPEVIAFLSRLDDHLSERRKFRTLHQLRSSSQKTLKRSQK